MQYYVFSTSAKITKAAAKRIQNRIKAIDNTADFVGPLSIPGSCTTGWIERPNDGRNSYGHVSARNQQMAAIAREELNIEM
jgi:hypothetical protein